MDVVPHTQDIDKIDCIKQSPLYQFAKGEPYVNDYNVLQIKVDNYDVDFIRNGTLSDEVLESMLDDEEDIKSEEIDLDEIF